MAAPLDAYDLAIVARNALAVPAISDTAAKISVDFTDPNGVGRHLVNHNEGFLRGYPGAIGLKTGYTKAASRTLLAAARRDGHTCVASVMGTWDDTGWASYLLDQCFAGVRVAGAPPLPPVRARRRCRTVSTRSPASPTPSAPGTRRHCSHGRRGRPQLRPRPRPLRRRRPRSNRRRPRPAADATRATGTPASATPDDGSVLGSVLRTAGLVLLGLLMVLVILRRRAVKRQRARRMERIRAHREARRRGMIDVLDGDDGSDIRALPARTGHHVAAAGRRRQSDRRVVRATRPRDRNGTTDRGRR